MADRIVRRVAARWLLGHDLPPQAKTPFTLPVPLVASLAVGDVVKGIDGAVYCVTAVGPGAIVLESAKGAPVAFTNEGYGAYSWAYFAAPCLHWKVSD